MDRDKMLAELRALATAAATTLDDVARDRGDWRIAAGVRAIVASAERLKTAASTPPSEIADPFAETERRAFLRSL